AGARAEATGFVPGAPGSGIGGRVTRADLAGAPLEAAAPVAAAATAGPATVRAFPGEYTDTPLKGIRKVIAERMMNSLATSAQLTYTATAPASGLLALRKRLKNAADPGLSAITVGDLVGYAAVKTLAKHAGVNAHLSDGVLRTFANVHLGMAVDTPRGLLVPTLRFADTLTLREFSQLSKQLANDAIGGSISPDLLSGASFTVSNLGAFGIESFTPLLNVPQVAILGVDAIFPRAVINADGSVGAEQRIGFSLTADHQVIDGADAARYLKDLCRAVADIDLTVLG
ncbi:MAG: 2-oxo acid dehydrogenase subunit E2, partial [Propionicimonas sp.]